MAAPPERTYRSGSKMQTTRTSAAVLCPPVGSSPLPGWCLPCYSAFWPVGPRGGSGPRAAEPP